MMNKHTLSQNTRYFANKSYFLEKSDFSIKNTRYFVAICLIFVMLSEGLTQLARADGLRIEPAAPIIAVGESIPLTVLGAEGEMTWLPPQAGEIRAQGLTRATYVAPNEVGQYYVQVFDQNGAKPIPAGIQVTVLPTEAAKRAFSREKSAWEVFTNRSNISAIALSEDGATLWVGTHGGLEKRDVATGQLIKVFTNLDGLPNNMVSALADDGNGGLWVGTSEGGLAHKNSLNEWKVFDTKNSDLPDNVVNALVNDGKGGVWIATGIPLDEDKLSRLLTAFTNSSGDNPLDSGLFDDKRVRKLLDDLFSNRGSNPLDGLLGKGQNGLLSGLFDKTGDVLLDKLLGGKSNIIEILIEGSLKSLLDCSKDDPFLELMFGDIFSASEGGLAHLSSKGQWTIFNTDNTDKSHLPTDIISDIVSDGKGGLWIGTHCGGLVHLSDRHKWTVYNMDNSGLPGNFVNTLYQEENGGLWVSTAFNGLAYRNRAGRWKVYNKANAGLPSNTVSRAVGDGNGGVWVGAGNVLEKDGGLVHIQRNGEATVFNTVNSDLPADTVVGLANDGRGGLWVGTYGGGLAHRSNGGDWTLLTQAELEQPNRAYSSLPDNFARAIVADGEGGLWIGTNSFIYDSGLAHMNSRNEWTIYNVDNSGLPENDIWALARDDNNGLWVGTIGGGLAYRSQGEWTVYNTKNSRLPDNDVIALLNDSKGGLWIGTAKGLTYRSRSGQWTTLNVFNSGLPDNTVGVLLNDSKGGLWIGTSLGLAHWNRIKGKWTVYNTNNSSLPHNLIAALVSDGNDGLWIATGVGHQGGLVHLNHLGQWTIYNTTNSDLPTNAIRALAGDESGGLWIGTLKGLVHRSLRGDWTLFDTTNSNLQYNRVLNLANDGSHGLWVLGWGLAHLTFSQKPFLCEKVPGITDEQCATLLKGNRAAIVIHPNGSGSGYEQDIAVDNMATHVYQTLFLRGYDHDEIHYIAYKPSLDFNGDGIPDYEVVDAPMTLQAFVRDRKPPESITLKHLENAFEWAKDRHRAKAADVPEEPLVVIFIDHGKPDNLVLNSSGETVNEVTFKALLDDYQTETGNKVVVILEACHTGTLVNPPLLQEEPNRLIITSTNEKRAYYKDSGRTSFTRFYFDDLHRGADYWNSRQFVKSDIFAQLGEPFNQQEPQFKEIAPGKMAAFCLNQCYGKIPEPELIPEMPVRPVSSKDSIELVVNIKDNDNEILSVSVSVITPKEANKYNEQGFELNKSFPIENLTKGNNGKWFTRFSDFTEPGEYSFIFRAVYKIRSGRRTVSALKPVTVNFR